VLGITSKQLKNGLYKIQFLVLYEPLDPDLPRTYEAEVTSCTLLSFP
jgi:hypothetical protein